MHFTQSIRRLSLLTPSVSLALVSLALGAALLLATPAATAQAPAVQAAARPAQLSFESPQAAADALVDAVRQGEPKRLAAVLGPGARRVIDSGDAQADEQTRARFLAAHAQGLRLEAGETNSVLMLLGEAEWPVPFPIVKASSRWRFDTRAGLRQYLDRQIGANELDVLRVLDTYVEAQREYVLRDRTRNGLLEYAQRFVSSEGQRDGLYWPVPAGEPPSPMGARFAAAGLGRYRGTDDEPQPFHGYYFRKLTAQGPHAAGGAYNYMVKGHLIGGFALIATPARWGVSGVMSFIVNHDGVVFSRNLGRDTSAIAARISRFDPGPGWMREEQR